MAPSCTAHETWQWQRQQRVRGSRGPYLTPPRCRQAPALLLAAPAAMSCIQQEASSSAVVMHVYAIQCQQLLHGDAGLTTPPGCLARMLKQTQTHFAAYICGGLHPCTPVRQRAACSGASQRLAEAASGREANTGPRRACTVLHRKQHSQGQAHAPASARCAAQWRPGPRMLSAPRSPSQRWSP